ncbi:MAG TPA: DUF3034 family protein [Opitutaceae bacterium]|nr:DUF3034 family protein [Opitutaceae bacterium]HPG18401.1 DUF3034 family protein [Opitutaceae bacterium]
MKSIIRQLTSRTLILATALLGAATLSAQETAQATPDAPASKPAPLPLHQIEGNGGIFSTLSAYIVNPPRDGEPIGRPSVGFSYVNVGNGRHLEAFTLTESPWKRLELGYAYDTFDLGDLPDDIDSATGIRIHDGSVKLHNVNARLLLVEESDSLPAITAGVHFKSNQGIDRINTDLGGLLRTSGIAKHNGVDYTLYASKLFKSLPTPLLINAGLRATKAAHIGLLGFTDSYHVVAEANAVLFLPGNFALAAEYRQKPNDYTPVGTLVQREDDWWTLDAAYVVNSHLTLAVGYGHFGAVLNHKANSVWGVTTKYEF